jgi:hypothetical protein
MLGFLRIISLTWESSSPKLALEYEKYTDTVFYFKLLGNRQVHLPTVLLTLITRRKLLF